MSFSYFRVHFLQFSEIPTQSGFRPLKLELVQTPVDEDIGFDAAKVIHGRKRFLAVDTLGLVLRAFVTAANVQEREGGKKLLRRVKKKS